MDASALIWIDKAMGLVVPGFVPTPLGEVFESTPTRIETVVSAGTWAVGLLVVTGLLKIAIPIQHGTLRWPGRSLHAAPVDQCFDHGGPA